MTFVKKVMCREEVKRIERDRRPSVAVGYREIGAESERLRRRRVRERTKKGREKWHWKSRY
jgi:hypothetical protein